MNVTADAVCLTANGTISAASSGRGGDSGNVNLTVGGLLEIDGTAGRFLTGISTRTQPSIEAAVNPPTGPLLQDNAGRGGDVNVIAGELRMLGGGRIVAEAGEVNRPRRGGSGDGGNVRVNADRVSIAGLKPFDPAVPSAIRTRTYARTTGDAGDITVTADDLSLTRGGAIQADTNGTGTAGLVTIDAGRLTIRDSVRVSIPAADPAAAPTVLVQRPQVSSSALGSSADAGRGRVILIDAGTLAVDSGGLIAATSGAGTAGAAGRIQLGGDTIAVGRGGSILASTGKKSTGRGGDIRIGTRSRPVDRLIVRGGEISAATFGGGDGGEISGSVDRLEVSRRGRITADAAGGAAGQSGRVLIDAAESVTLASGGSLRTFSQSADAGSIRLRGGEGAKFLLSGGASIVTEAAAADRDGGDITLLLGQRLVVEDSAILTRSGGGGGNVTLTPRSIVLSGAVINANATTDDGGNIVIFTQDYFRDGKTTITADSTLAQPGTISVDTLQVDLASILAPLSGSPLSATDKLEAACKLTENDASSFTVQGKGGGAGR